LKYKILSLVALLLANCHAFGQPNLDTLINKVKTLSGHQKVLMLKQIGDSLYDLTKYSEAAGYYENSALEELKLEKPHLKSVCEGLTEAGFCFETTNQYTKAITFYKRSLVYSKQANDMEEMAAAYNNMGTSYSHLGNYALSIQNFELALKLDQKLANEEMISLDYNNIGKVYQIWKKYPQALQYYKLSLEIANRLNKLPFKAIRMSSIGMVYKQLSMLDSAAWYVNEALKIDTKLGNKDKIAVRLANLGSVFTLMKKYNEAETNLKKAIAIFEELKNDYSLAISLNDLGDCYLAQNRLNEAKEQYFKSLDKSKLATVRLTELNNYQDLSLVFEKEQNHLEALVYFKKFNGLKDSLFTEDNLKSINDLQVRFETELKEVEIVKLQQLKEINLLKLKKRKAQILVLIGFVMFTFILLATLYNRFLLKKKTNALLDEKNTTLNLLNATKDKFFTIIAHDLKNPLSAFRNVTKGLKDNFSDLTLNERNTYLNNLYESSSNLYSLLNNLLQWAKTQTGSIKNNLEQFNLHQLVEVIISTELQKTDSDGTTVENKVAMDLEIFADKNIISTIVRNLVSNALKFTEKAGKIEILAAIENKHVHISIEDNGIGISSEDMDKLFKTEIDPKVIGSSDRKGTGLGLILCKELAKIAKGDIKVESKLGKGSRFSIMVPVKS